MGECPRRRRAPLERKVGAVCPLPRPPLLPQLVLCMCVLCSLSHHPADLVWNQCHQARKDTGACLLFSRADRPSSLTPPTCVCSRTSSVSICRLSTISLLKATRRYQCLVHSSDLLWLSSPSCSAHDSIVGCHLPCVCIFSCPTV